MDAFPFDVAPPDQRNHRWDVDCSDQQFLELMHDLRGHGGMLPIEELRSICHVCNPGISVSKLLMQNMLFSVLWRREHWMPCFQFSPVTWLPIPAVSSLVQQLKPAMRSVELAMWFKTSHPLLGGKSPLELFNNDKERVQKYAALSSHERHNS